MSPITILAGPVPVEKSTRAANEPVVMEPEMLVFLNTETVLLVSFTTTKSGLPSPSISLMAIIDGIIPVVKSTLVSKEPVVIYPGVLVFLRTDSVLRPSLLTISSGLPSPAIALITTANGSGAIVKSTRAANEPAVMEPEVLVFRKTETVLLAMLVTAISGLPSPSISPMAIVRGLVPVVKSTLSVNESAVIEPELLV